MAGSYKFGWVYDVGTGLQMTAPSRPFCELVGVPFEQLNGSYICSENSHFHVPVVARSAMTSCVQDDNPAGIPV